MSESSSNYRIPVEEQTAVQFVLEYAAMLPSDKTFTETISAFCRHCDLQIEDASENQITASGTDFAIDARALEAPSDHIVRVIHLVVMTEDEYDLQNAREIIEERLESSEFSTLILLRDSIGEMRSIEAYRLLNELENTLRKLVVVRSASLSGGEWWSNRAHPAMGNSRQADNRRVNEENDNDITERYDLTHHTIFYCDLLDLKAIISDKHNWSDGFSFDLKVLRNIERLDFLNRLRRKIAHNRFLSQRNLNDLRQIHSHIMRLCDRSLNKVSS